MWPRRVTLEFDSTLHKLFSDRIDGCWGLNPSSSPVPPLWTPVPETPLTACFWPRLFLTIQTMQLLMNQLLDSLTDFDSFVKKCWIRNAYTGCIEQPIGEWSCAGTLRFAPDQHAPRRCLLSTCDTVGWSVGFICVFLKNIDYSIK